MSQFIVTQATATIVAAYLGSGMRSGSISAEDLAKLTLQVREALTKGVEF